MLNVFIFHSQDKLIKKHQNVFVKGPNLCIQLYILTYMKHFGFYNFLLASSSEKFSVAKSVCSVNPAECIIVLC